MGLEHEEENLDSRLLHGETAAAAAIVEIFACLGRPDRVAYYSWTAAAAREEYRTGCRTLAGFDFGKDSLR